MDKEKQTDSTARDYVLGVMKRQENVESNTHQFPIDGNNDYELFLRNGYIHCLVVTPVGHGYELWDEISASRNVMVSDYYTYGNWLMFKNRDLALLLKQELLNASCVYHCLT